MFHRLTNFHRQYLYYSSSRYLIGLDFIWCNKRIEYIIVNITNGPLKSLFIWYSFRFLICRKIEHFGDVSCNVFMSPNGLGVSMVYSCNGLIEKHLHVSTRCFQFDNNLIFKVYLHKANRQPECYMYFFSWRIEINLWC